ncbi:MAG: PIN domain-containing protein [Planctomycetota bacterium]|nr:PIN domain-containing protein [Planctomycetota bacterium]
MPALCDVNLLLALSTDRHAHNLRAVEWLDTVPTAGAVICRVAQCGLLRLLNNPAVMRMDVLDAAACWRLWSQLLQDDRIRFTTAEPPGLDSVFVQYTSGRPFSPKLWTDAYLAAFAHAGGLTVTTFDQGFRQFSDLSCEILFAN